MNLKGILMAGAIYGLVLASGCSGKKELGQGVVFEQKKNIDYKTFLKKSIKGVNIDSSFAKPRYFGIYREEGIDVMLWTNEDFGREVYSNWISNACLRPPYFQEMSLKNISSTNEFNKNLLAEIEGMKREYEKKASAIDSWEERTELQKPIWAKERTIRSIPNSEVLLTDYLENGNEKQEAFIVPEVSANSYIGGHIFLDKDYIDKNDKPELAYACSYQEGEGTITGMRFSYIGALNFKKVNDIWCSSFVISKNADFSAFLNYFVIGKFKKKGFDAKIQMDARRIDKFDELSKEISDIIGDEPKIIFGFTEWPLHH